MPTFGRGDSVLLDTRERRAVHVPEGMSHALLALEEDSIALFLRSTPFMPERDAAAPSLAEAAEQGTLPSYAARVEFYASLP